MRNKPSVVMAVPLDFHGSAGCSEGSAEMLKLLKRTALGRRSRVKHFRKAKDAKSFTILRQDMKKELRRAEKSGERIVVLGGNHLVSLAVLEHFKGRRALFVSFDAHIDLFDRTFNLTHGNFLNFLKGRDEPILFHLGNREGRKTENIAWKKLRGEFLSNRKISSMGVQPTVASMGRHANSAEIVILDIDLDVISNKFFQACAFQSKGGMSPSIFFSLIGRILEKYGPDCVVVSEFNPKISNDATSVGVVRKLLELISKSFS